MTRTVRGFTLIEMLLVVLFTSVVMAFAVNFYLQLSRQSSAAAALTEGGRRTALTLDRIARDLQEAVLIVRPEDTDPLAHPWLFLADATRGGDGADRLKFQTRAHRPRSGADHESDLAVVAFWTVPDDEGRALHLLRWSRPRLPESLDQSFPRRDDEGVQVLAENVASFGVRLLGEDGEWTDRWDSSTLARSNTLPIQAELRLALWDPQIVDTAFEEEPEPDVRRVLLPIRPLDLTPPEEGEGDDEGEDDEENEDECVTVNECRQLNPEIFSALAGDNPAIAGILDELGGECFDEQAAAFGIDPGEVVGCEP